LRVTELLDELGKIKSVDQKAVELRDNTECVKFENLSFCAPDKTPLINDFTLEIHRNLNLLITGKNGAGKSSLFRVLSGLWPSLSGKCMRPTTYVDNDPKKGCNMFYVPQKPYLCKGTLRDQVTYPVVLRDSSQDDKIRECLKETGLTKFMRANLDITHHDWSSVLSGGEKQRMGFARLFYHKPVFAVLDEATSAVEPKGQRMLYETTREKRITLISIAHREELIEFHDMHIEFLGHGEYRIVKNAGDYWDKKNRQSQIGKMGLVEI